MVNYCFQCQCSSIGRIIWNVSTIVECCTLHAVGGKLNASAKPHKVRANERQKRHTKEKHVQENCQKCQRQDMHPTTTMCCMMCERKHRNLLNIHKYISAILYIHKGMFGFTYLKVLGKALQHLQLLKGRVYSYVCGFATSMW